jgi:WD40 repeat protein
LWEVGVWDERVPIGGACFAFSPDSKVLAVETNKGVIRLVDPETTREYARLEDPHQDRAFCLGFSPDGTQLVTTNRESQSIHVWDLRAMRRQLAEIDLDWEQLPYPPPTGSTPAIPLKVIVDLGELAKPVGDG